MKLTSDERRSAHAAKQMTAATSATSAATAIAAPGAPAVMPATEVPTSSEIAEVGPIASCRELPNSA